MVKDFRYPNVREAIRKKIIKDFEQIFNHIPRTVVAKDLRMSNRRIDRIIKKPWLFSMLEIMALANLIEMDQLDLFKMTIKHCKPKKQTKKKPRYKPNRARNRNNI